MKEREHTHTGCIPASITPVLYLQVKTKHFSHLIMFLTSLYFYSSKGKSHITELHCDLIWLFVQFV